MNSGNFKHTEESPHIRLHGVGKCPTGACRLLCCDVFEVKGQGQGQGTETNENEHYVSRRVSLTVCLSVGHGAAAWSGLVFWL
jgi:hypothetical protein